MQNQITPLTFPEADTASPFKDLKAVHVAIRTADYEAAIRWYKEKPDFRLIREWTSGEMQLAFLALPDDDSFVIEILCVKGTGPAATPEVLSGYAHICFNVENLDKTVEALNARNIGLTRSFNAPAIGKRVAFIEDPFGNAIEFCEDMK